MKSKIQMQVAKHMIAVWTNVNDPDSLKEAFNTINNVWPELPRRELRVWAKALHKNPERYEFTGYAFKTQKLTDHFTDEEIVSVLDMVQKFAKNNFDNVIRNIIHHKYVYGMDTFSSIEHGLAMNREDNTEERFNRKYRPAKPVLKA